VIEINFRKSQTKNILYTLLCTSIKREHWQEDNTHTISNASTTFLEMHSEIMCIAWIFVMRIFIQRIKIKATSTETKYRLSILKEKNLYRKELNRYFSSIIKNQYKSINSFHWWDVALRREGSNGQRAWSCCARRVEYKRLSTRSKPICNTEQK